MHVSKVKLGCVQSMALLSLIILDAGEQRQTQLTMRHHDGPEVQNSRMVRIESRFRLST